MRIRWLAVPVLAALVLACGPSDLSRAYDAFRAAAEPRIEEEARAWEQIAGLAQYQDDERAVARYRSHLQDKALPYYAGLERDFEALAPAHERLAPARTALIEYAKARRDFVSLEIQRIDLAASVAQLAEIQRAEEATNSTRSDYVQAVGDDVPDPRFAEVGAIVGDFVRGPYQKSVTGAMEAADAVAFLRREALPKLEKLRNDRYDDQPVTRALRKHVVACDDFLRLLADGLPTVVDVLRSKGRVEAAQADASRHREEFQKVFREVQRDR
jgi:hypothetical protein